MSKLKSFNIFLLAAFIMLGAFTSIRDAHLKTFFNTEANTEYEFESFQAEPQHHLDLIALIAFNSSHLLSEKSSEQQFIVVSAVINFTLPQLLSSNRIALPPPALV